MSTPTPVHRPDDPTTVTPPPRRGPARRTVVVLVVAGVLVVLGVAAAVVVPRLVGGDGPDDAAIARALGGGSTGAAGGGGGPDGGPAGGGPGRGAGRGAGPVLGQVTHGEFVLDAAAGGRTVAVQRGDVVSVTPTSIALRSTDGYVGTYRLEAGVQIRADGEDTTVSAVTPGASGLVVGGRDGAGLVARTVDVG